MKIYARHFFYRIIAVFCVVNVLVVSMLSLLQLSKFSYILDCANLAELAYIICLGTPSMIFIIAPLSAALASSYTYITSSKKFEIIILQKLGQSNFDIVQPGLLFGVLVMLLSLYMGFFLGPKSFGGMQKKILTLKGNYSLNYLAENSFNKFAHMQTYLGKRIGKNTFQDVLVFDWKNHNIYLSQKAIFNLKNNCSFIELYNGTVQKGNSNGKSCTLLFDKFIIKGNFDQYKTQKIIQKTSSSKILQNLLVDDNPKSFIEINKRILWSMYSLLMVLVVLSALFEPKEKSFATLKPFVYLTCIIILYLLLSSLSEKHLGYLYIHYAIFSFITIFAVARLRKI